MAYDQEVIDAILRRAGQVKDPRKRNRYTRAALQTGIVESGLRNLNYGDADSLGWRQERASLYPNPTNVDASVDRFFREAAQHDRGQASWELAADVQRPAAQYRGRYKDVARQAASLLGGGGGSSGASPSRPSGSTNGASAGRVSGPVDAQLPIGADFSSLLSSLLSRPEQQAAPATPVAAPSFLKAPNLPQGFQPVMPVQQEAPPQERPVSQALGLLESLRGPEPTDTAPEGLRASDGPQMPSIVEAVEQRKQTRASGSLTSLGDEALEVAANLGYQGHSGQRTDQRNAEVGGSEDSDHLMRQGRMAYDIPMTGEKNLSRVGSSIARRFRVPQTKPGWWEGTIQVGRRKVRVQIIAGAQHDHGDHVHVGFRAAS